MDMQKLIDTMNDVSRATRAGYHITLGKMIAALEKADKSLPVVFIGGGGPGAPHSYRGYYSDLAFEPTNSPIKAGTFLRVCKEALDKTFVGYKGGDFVMDDRTPLWISEHGIASEMAIVGVDIGENEVVIQTRMVF